MYASLRSTRLIVDVCQIACLPYGVQIWSAASRRAISRVEQPPATVSWKIRRTTSASGS